MKRIAALLMCWLLMTSAAAEKEIPELLEPVGVTMDTAAAYIGDLRETVMYDAYVAPETMELSFQIDGRIGGIHAMLGQQVKAGDVLVTLDHEDLRESTENLRENILMHEKVNAYDDAMAQIDMQLLELELAQLLCQPVVDEKAVALKRLEMEAKQLSQEQAQKKREMELDRLYETLARQEKDLVIGAMTAPFDGRIAAAANVEPGTYVVAYSPVVYLVDDTKLSIVSEFITTSELAGAEEIYAIIGSERYEIVHREMDSQEYAALVISGAAIDVVFDFAQQPEEDVTAGLYAGVCLVRRAAENALLVPTNAVFSEENEKYVYVVNNGERVRTYVETGITTAWETQILGGIEEGTIVYVQE